MTKIELQIANYRREIELNPQKVETYQLLAETLTNKGDLEGAIACYEKTLELQPNIWGVYQKLADIYWQKGQLSTAVSTIEKGIELNPDFSWFYHKLGLIFLELQQWQKAATALEKAVKLNPDFYASYEKLGEALSKLENWSEAVATYQNAAKIQALSYWGENKLGEALMKLDEFEEAIAAFNRAIEIKPNLYFAYHNLGEALSQLKRWDEAVINYQKSLEINPDSYWSYTNLGDVYIQLENWNRAVEAYRRAMEIQPNLYVSYSQLGEAFVKLGKIEEAIASYQTALKLEPKDRQTYHKLGDAFQEKGNFEEAIAAYDRARILNPNVPWSYNKLAEAFAKIQKWNEAIYAYLHALNLLPDMPWIHKELGNVLSSRTEENLEEAIIYYCQAIDQQYSEGKNSENYLNFLPNKAELYLYLGNALTKREQLNGAIVLYNIGLQIKQDDFKISVELNKVLKIKQHLKNHVASCQLAVKKNPTSFQLYYNLGVALTRQEKWYKAAEAYLQSIKLNPKINWSDYRIWESLKSSGQLDEVVKFYKETIKNEEDYVSDYLNLGDALTELGKVNEAINCYKKVAYWQTLESNPIYVKNYWDKKGIASPDFLVIGSGKGGTTSLYSYMSEHPQILPAIKKEVYFWTRYFEKGIDWYLAHFPPIPEKVKFLTGEGTPTYLNSREAAERLFGIFPKIKLIAILRNPADRAISHYHHEVRLNAEHRSFKEAIATQLEKFEERLNPWNHASYYITYGLYAECLKHWMSIFPREQFLILKSEDFYINPATTMKEVFKFLELPDYQLEDYKKFNSGSYDDISESSRRQLADFFRPYNEELEDYLGMKFNWE